MGLGDLGNKAKDAMNSEKGEKYSDDAIERGSDFANEKTGGKHADKIDKGGDKLDESVGETGSGENR